MIVPPGNVRNMSANRASQFTVNPNTLRWLKSGYAIAIAIALILSGCEKTPPTGPPGKQNFVYIHDSIPEIILDVRYYSADNFMGVPVDGYNKPLILITAEAGEALASVQQSLRKQALGLKIFDAYRPQKAVDHFVRWAADPTDTLTKSQYYPGLPKGRLFELGYIAAKSGHTRGSTLDLTLVDLNTGAELDMGSGWDLLGKISNHDSPLVNDSATTNRERLKSVMMQNGFQPYSKEWWHYTLENEPYPNQYFDFNVE